MPKLRLLLLCCGPAMFIAPGCDIDPRTLSTSALSEGGAGEGGEADGSAGMLDPGSGGTASNGAAGAPGAAGSAGAAGETTAGAAGSGGAGSESANGAGGVGGEAGSGGTLSSHGGQTSSAGVPSGGPTSGAANGGARSGNGGTTGGGNGSGGKASGGTAGAAPAEPVCADLNGNHISDCSESLVKNSSFSSVSNGKPSDWSSDTAGTVAWSAMDAVGGGSSGSAIVTNSDPHSATLGIRQCVSAHAGSTYDAIVHSFIESSGASGLARVSIAFFAQDNCSGTAQSLIVSPFDGTTSSWRTLQLLGVKAPSGVSALELRLELLKLPTAASSTVHFDDVLLLAR